MRISDTMNAQEYLNFELEFDLNNPYESTDQEFLDTFPSEHQEHDIDKVIVDVVEEAVGLNVAQRPLENLLPVTVVLRRHLGLSRKTFGLFSPTGRWSWRERRRWRRRSWKECEESRVFVCDGIE